jgi:hypothetical protein
MSDNQPEKKVVAADVVITRHLLICGSDCEPRISMRVDDDGAADVSFLDLLGRVRMFVGTTPGGYPYAVMYDRNGVQRMVCSLRNDEPFVSVKNTSDLDV